MDNSVSSIRITPEPISGLTNLAPTRASETRSEVFNLPGSLLASDIPPPISSVTGDQRAQLIAQATERASQAPLGQVQSRASEANEKLAAAQNKLKEAGEAGVELAKLSFFKKLANVATAVLAVVMAGALSAVSFGGATPLLAIACVNLAVSIGDSVCAYRNFKDAQLVAAGGEAVHNLPAGGSIVKNLLYGLATACGASDERAKDVAKYGNAVFQTGLILASLAVGAMGVVSGAAAAMPLENKVCDLVANSVNLLISGETVVRSFRFERHNALLSDIGSLARDLQELSQLDQLDDRIEQLIEESQEKTESVRRMLSAALDNYGGLEVNAPRSLVGTCRVFAIGLVLGGVSLSKP